MKSFQCTVCSFLYEEENGLPLEGIAAGTPWDNIPADWRCPDCGTSTDDFERVEI